MSNFVNIEVIQTLPFSNANRDDAGQPKTVTFGGVSRGRLSSQSLKRAARFYGADKEAGFDPSAKSSTGYYRTKQIKNLVIDAIRARHGEESAVKNAKAIDGAIGDKLILGNQDKEKGKEHLVSTLVVLTDGEINAIADHIHENGKIANEDVRNILTTSHKKDIALWGRFFASGSDATLDGSAQVAHAITTHSVSVEPDFFVGMDDASDLYANHAGGGHPGDSFYLQGTFYKYANFNIEETVLNLLNADLSKIKGQHFDADKTEGIEDLVAEIAEKFITSFALAVPQGKIRSTAHTTLPSLVRVTVTPRQPVNAVTAFEQPVKGDKITQESVNRLNEEVRTFESFLGAPTAAYVLTRGDLSVDALGEAVDSLGDLNTAVTDAIRPIVTAAVQKITN